MANPQLEKGYTRIANEILMEIMKADLNGTQFRILLAIWRFTYGFQRKEYEMSYSQLATYINGSKTQVARELETLIERKIINVVGTGKRGSKILAFNKNYSEWLNKSKTAEKAEQAAQEIAEESTEKLEKKSNSKKRVYDENNTYYKMAIYFYDKVAAVAKDAGIEHLIRKSYLHTWADDMRKLIEIDKVDKRLAKDVMDWVTQHDFWKTNVLSAKKLREKFAELAIKMNAEKTKKNQYHKPQQQFNDTRDREIALQRWIAEGRDPDDFKW